MGMDNTYKWEMDQDRLYKMEMSWQDMTDYDKCWFIQKHFSEEVIDLLDDKKVVELVENDRELFSNVFAKHMEVSYGSDETSR
tara:strand:- start:114 stop:362 length:249 start_codon:yes stop_codon:yes gene_type:complete